MESQTLWTFLRAMLQIPPKRFKMTQGVQMDLDKWIVQEPTIAKDTCKMGAYSALCLPFR